MIPLMLNLKLFLITATKLCYNILNLKSIRVICVIFNTVINIFYYSVISSMNHINLIIELTVFREFSVGKFLHTLVYLNVGA